MVRALARPSLSCVMSAQYRAARMMARATRNRDSSGADTCARATPADVTAGATTGLPDAGIDGATSGATVGVPVAEPAGVSTNTVAQAIQKTAAWRMPQPTASYSVAKAEKLGTTPLIRVAPGAEQSRSLRRLLRPPLRF